MTPEEILDDIGTGMVLCVPHDKENKQPFLFHVHEPRTTWLTWNELDLLMNAPTFPRLLCKAEKEDILWQSGGKKGWKNMGWNGVDNDYYRMVQ